MIDKRVLTPFQKFFRIESLSAVLLFAGTVIALVWANSAYGYLYTSLWEYKVGFTTEGFELYKPLILWVNDGLMAIFFFLIGLEIKREVLIGELNTMRKAALPFFAALGGMLIPVAMFMILNREPDTAAGWGIPMATDIAFTLAILKILGKRIPIGLTVFLTAFAIVDDIGAVIAIAVFYSGHISWGLLGTAAVLLAILFYLAYRGIYLKFLVFGLGVIIWILFLKAGVHPTVAGILLAFTIPIRRKIGVSTYADNLMQIATDIKSTSGSGHPMLTNAQIARLDDLEDLTSQVQSPLQHLEHSLHSWVAYLIIPVFALANAGIVFSADISVDTQLAMIIAVSLVFGKCIGIPVLTWLGIRLGVADLPAGVTFRHVIGVGFLAGIGFTMSIFIATLAFANNPELIDSAKIGVLAGSAVAALLGYVILRTGSSDS
jgi:NhaA family Na+:H+ antiporter